MSKVGLVGLSFKSLGSVPAAVPVKVRVAVLAKTVETIGLPEAARSGILKYWYSGIVICSV